jgi:hypothetical protein
VGAVTRLIAHHPGGLTLFVELAILVALIAVFGAIWLRERHRRADRTRRVPEMRD